MYVYIYIEREREIDRERERERYMFICVHICTHIHIHTACVYIYIYIYITGASRSAAPKSYNYEGMWNVGAYPPITMLHQERDLFWMQSRSGSSLYLWCIFILCFLAGPRRTGYAVDVCLCVCVPMLSQVVFYWFVSCLVLGVVFNTNDN